jgi:hypothetical protein
VGKPAGKSVGSAGVGVGFGVDSFDPQATIITANIARVINSIRYII